MLAKLDVFKYPDYEFIHKIIECAIVLKIFAYLIPYFEQLWA